MPLGGFVGGLTGATLGSLVVKVMADTNQFVVGMGKGGEELEGFHGKIVRNSQAMQTMGLALMGASSLIVGALGLATKASIDFNDSFVGIEKTAGELTLKQLPQVRQGIIDLSKEIPVATGELNRLGETAGQLGADGVDQLLAFVRMGAMMGETTDLEGNRAIKVLKRVADILRLNTDETWELANGMVHLGNNMNASESEIAEFLIKLAPAAAAMRLTKDETLGWAASMAALGQQPNAISTSFLEMQRQIQRSVRDGGDRLKEFAGMAGVSAEQFAMVWKEKPGLALFLIVRGLHQIVKQGGDAAGAIDELFNKSKEGGQAQARLLRMLLAAASGFETLSENIDLANEGIEENKALEEEAARAFNKTASKVDILYNNVKALAIAVGETLEPVLRDLLVNTLTPTVSKIEEWVRLNPELTQTMTYTGVTLGGLAAAISVGVVGLGQMGGAAAALKISLGALAVGIATLVGWTVPLALLGAEIGLFWGMIEKRIQWSKNLAELDSQYIKQIIKNINRAQAEGLEDFRALMEQKRRETIQLIIDRGVEEIKAEGEIQKQTQAQVKSAIEAYLRLLEQRGVKENELNAKRWELTRHYMLSFEAAQSQYMERIKIQLEEEVRSFAQYQASTAGQLAEHLAIYRNHHQDLSDILDEIVDGHNEHWDLFQQRLGEVKVGLEQALGEANEEERSKLQDSLVIVQDLLGLQLDEFKELDEGVREYLAGVLGSLDKYQSDLDIQMTGLAKIMTTHLDGQIDSFEAYETDLRSLLRAVNQGNDRAWGQFQGRLAKAKEEAEGVLWDLKESERNRLQEALDIAKDLLGLTAEQYEHLDVELKNRLGNVIGYLESYSEATEKELGKASQAVEEHTETVVASTAKSEAAVRSAIIGFDLLSKPSEDLYETMVRLRPLIEEELGATQSVVRDFFEFMEDQVKFDALQILEQRVERARLDVVVHEKLLKLGETFRVFDNENYKLNQRLISLWDNMNIRGSDIWKNLTTNLIQNLLISGDALTEWVELFEANFEQVERTLWDAGGGSWIPKYMGNIRGAIVDNTREIHRAVEDDFVGPIGRLDRLEPSLAKLLNAFAAPPSLDESSARIRDYFASIDEGLATIDDGSRLREMFSGLRSGILEDTGAIREAIEEDVIGPLQQIGEVEPVWNRLVERLRAPMSVTEIHRFNSPEESPFTERGIQGIVEPSPFMSPTPARRESLMEEGQRAVHIDRIAETIVIEKTADATQVLSILQGYLSRRIP